MISNDFASKKMVSKHLLCSWLLEEVKRLGDGELDEDDFQKMLVAEWMDLGYHLEVGKRKVVMLFLEMSKKTFTFWSSVEPGILIINESGESVLWNFVNIGVGLLFYSWFLDCFHYLNLHLD